MTNETLAWILACGFISCACWLWGLGVGVSRGWDSGYEFCLKRMREIAQQTVDEIDGNPHS